MEGNECYKFGTIKNFLEKTGAPPIRVAADVGGNIGEMSLLMAEYFPNAVIHLFEPVEKYFDAAVANCRHIRRIKPRNVGITAQHMFADDVGQLPAVIPLHLFIAKPNSGPGWLGGNFIERASEHSDARYEKTPVKIPLLTLDQAVAEILAEEHSDGVDLIKFDCEHCERSSIGCASISTLQNVRYIVGEYHDLQLFYKVLENKLFKTHFVSLIGNHQRGAFFAERLTDGPSILLKDRSGMLQLRPWLAPFPICWNIFDKAWVPAGESAAHGY